MVQVLINYQTCSPQKHKNDLGVGFSFRVPKLQVTRTVGRWQQDGRRMVRDGLREGPGAAAGMIQVEQTTATEWAAAWSWCDNDNGW